ncbi:MAG: hypothetical protein D6784_07415 [Chloroflexi bacterium]|nr:MAG: hypothetical protein D6784_07415 [Chloroflexota bacterium]
MINLRRWIQNHPHFLELLYRFTERVFVRLDPLWSRLGYGRVERLIKPFEDAAKKLIFDCRVCGQCILHSTGMTCPMTCPKNLRNGPCGGVRVNGHCEVIPEMRCVWVEAFERSQKMPVYGAEIRLIQPPMDWRLEGTSAWVNLLTGEDTAVQPGWQEGVEAYGR